MILRRSEIEGLTRRQREKLKRKGEMLSAARQVFARRGYGETTLDEVAELAEFGKGTLYNYFPNKEALFTSVLEQTVQGFLTIFSEVLDPALELSFQERIRTLLERSIRHAFSDPEGILLMLRESHHLRQNNPLLLAQPRLVRPLADTIAAEQQRNPSMMQNDPRRLAMLLMNLVMGQFMGRVHSRLHAMRSGSGSPEEGTYGDATCPGGMSGEIFASFKSETLEDEVKASTDLVYNIYFHGIFSAQNS